MSCIFILAVGLCLPLFYFIDVKRKSLPKGARSNPSRLEGCVERLTRGKRVYFTVVNPGHSLNSKPSARMVTLPKPGIAMDRANKCNRASSKN